MEIHPLAVVSPSARLGRDVRIGPFCVIEPDVSVGDGCQLGSGVVVKTGTRLGEDTQVHEGTILGGLPQHLNCPEQCGGLVIGRENVIREHVTIHRGLEQGSDTLLGDSNLVMVGVHVAHDCRIGSHVIFANNVMLAGHVSVDDRAYLSGAVGIHQFCRIGALAMVGGQSHVVKDIPPYVTVDGLSTCVVGLNRIGLRRNGFSRDEIAQLKDAYRLIYRSGLPFSEVTRRLALEFPAGPAADFSQFFAGGTRGFTPARSAPPGATIALHPDLEDTTETRSKAG